VDAKGKGGLSFDAKGTIWIEEIKDLLKEVRLITKEVKRLRRLTGSLGFEKTKAELDKKTNKINDRLKIVEKNYATNEDLSDLKGQFDELRNKVNSMKFSYDLAISTIRKDVQKNKKRLDRQEALDRLKSWGFELLVGTGFDNSPSTKVVMNPIEVGMSFYLKKGVKYFRSAIFFGVNSVEVNPVWSWIPSFEVRMTKKSYFGAALTFTNDLGDMEGWERIAWGGGTIMRFDLLNNLSLSWTITLGVTGVRGELTDSGRTKPSFSENIGSRLFLSHPL
jgi:hypothetical protein